MSDDDLIEQFHRMRDEAAFTQLVERHIHWVYSVALRTLSHEENAREVAQQVFTLLAQKASDVKDGNHLTAWLYRTCRNLCLESIRRDSRRRAREEEAAERWVTSPTQDPWDSIARHLEPAIDALAEPDREAILKRFFENQSLRDVGLALGINESTAQKRVRRALDKLRGILDSRGIQVSSATLSGLLLSHAAPAVPAGWAATVVTQSLGTGAVTLTLLNMIQTMQLKSTAMMLGVAVITGSGTYWFHNQARETLQHENQQLTATNQILVQAQQDLQGKAASLRQENDRLQKNLVDLHRLRNEATQARQLAEKLRQMEDLNRRLLAGMDEASTDARNAPQVDTSTMMIEPGVGLGPIQLGMAAEEVKQILGEPDVQIGTALQYMQLGMAILPRRKDGKVGAIMIGDSEGGSLAEAFKGSTREGIAMGAERDAIVGAFGEPTPRQRPDAQMDPRMLEAFLGDSGLRPEDLDLKKLEARSGIERLEYPDTGMTFLLRDGKLVHITME